ncbi:MAG: hypothetical protein ISR52_09945 [Rhodospirillales bacterium]|nr:hypothetical protein [Rhodospirillales bacterium]
MITAVSASLSPSDLSLFRDGTQAHERLQKPESETDTQQKNGDTNEARSALQQQSLELSEQERIFLARMRQRDQEVRRHEQAHASAAGPYGGSPSYEYQRGPDGKLYAVGGEVSIDVSAEGDPEATARKMEVVIRAAQAPADPSSQDRIIAAKARQIKQRAEVEIRQEQTEEQEQVKEEKVNPYAPSLEQVSNAYQQTVNAVSAANPSGGENRGIIV